MVALIFSIPSLIKKTRDMSTQIPFGPLLLLGVLFMLLLQIKLKTYFSNG